MRILQVIHGYPLRFNAGSEVYTQTLSQELVKQGHEVRVFTRIENPFIPDYVINQDEDIFMHNGVKKKIPLYLINVARQKDRYQSDGVDEAFEAVIKEYSPDIVHFQHLNHLSINLIEIVHNLSIPMVFTLHDYWLACPRGQFIQINYGEKEPWKECDKQEDRKCAINCYSRYFTGLNHNAEKDIEYWTTWVRLRRERLELLLSYVDVFIAPSQWLKRRLEKELPIIKNKSVCLDYGFDLERLSGRKRVREEKIVFGYIGTHIVTKGIHLLLQAFSKLSTPARLRIWGRHRGETTPYLKELVDHLSLPSFLEIEWMGEYENEKIISKVFNNMDILVVPSIWDENSPLVIHEGLQAKVPIITSDKGGMGEYVKHMVNGLNFKHRDVESLRKTMEWAINNFNELLKIAQRGYLQSETGNVISSSDHAKEILQIYHSLINKKKIENKNELLERDELK